MAALRDIARITSEGPGVDAGEDQSNAWLLWRSVTEEAKRRNCPITDDGFYVYTGALRTHVRRLWGTLGKDKRIELEKRLYAFLRSTDIARCVQKKEPPVWHIAVTWHPERTAVVRTYRMTRAERRVSPEEAGENLPPGEVTVKTKETSHVTTTTNVADEREARHALIVELLDGFSEPLTSEEIAYALGASKNDTRKDVKELRNSGKIAFRQESTEERKARYGGSPKAMAAFLYSTKSPVPERKTRELVDGFVKSPAPHETHMSHAEISRRFAKFFHQRSPQTRFTSATLEAKTGVGVQTVRGRLRKLWQEGLIIQAGHIEMRQAYRMKDKQKLLDYLGSQVELHFLVSTPQQEESTVIRTKTPPQPQEGFDLLGRAAEILDENERLRQQNAGLKSSIDELKKKVDELEGQLDELTRPQVDPQTLERLQRWQPSA